MIRIVFVALVVMVAWCALARLVRGLKAANIDWTSVTAVIAFIALAFWLRHVTGIGGF
jgi:fumarate reductase subunit D